MECVIFTFKASETTEKNQARQGINAFLEGKEMVEILQTQSSVLNADGVMETDVTISIWYAQA